MSATNDFPLRLKSRENEIKREIKKDQKTLAKNMGLKPLKDYRAYYYEAFFRKYEVFGEQTAKIYSDITRFSQIRNRVHIQNHFQTLKRDEEPLFSEEQLREIAAVLMHILKTMSTIYPRTTAGDNERHWLLQLEDVAV